MIKKQFEFNQHKFSAILPDQAAESVWVEIFKEREYKAADKTIEEAANAIVDVGAHVGLFSLYVRALNHVVPIFALEPEDTNFGLLEQNLKENKLTNIKTLKIALGGRSEHSNLLISSDSHNHRLEGTPSPVQSDIGEVVQNNQTIQIYSLRDFLDINKIKKISLLKMDIEGGEYDVFSACMPADFARIGAIVMEYHNYGSQNYKEIESQLRENGFGVQIFPSKFEKKMGFIFAKNKRI
ncbi:MAG: FkbM family methyltransferase [Candidatus Magasanikbacteria bacterium]